ncbi:hypothetical protein KOR34_04520 [Posidoniimonas corsicana]|uniref:Uncharacterized protein n=2 Tax=Posidoniimonas corsicana TaxID=1938618 RepID=A0A5C5VCJ6_9BACT|nr:hypothetical protein KOR34_04520 [Posidoniimonas corsicana]
MLVDQLRERWVAGEIGSIDAHWEAIVAMDHNSRSLGQQLDVPLVDSPFAERTGTDFLLVSDFLRELEPRLPGTHLPIGWEVTSDSIAARIAGLLDAGLVLLKSAPPPVTGANARALADAGYVDEFFPTASIGLREVLFQTL